MTMTGCVSTPQGSAPNDFVLDYHTPVDGSLQTELEAIDATLRSGFGMTPDQTAVGVLDLKTSRLAMIRPDQIMYGASVPKIAILLAYFQLRPQAATNLDAQTHHELGLMIKASSNELAAKYSQELGLAQIRRVLDQYGFYDAARGGGIWVGKHYGLSNERTGDPVADHSHAATVRQLLRFCLLLEQGRLVSPTAARVIRDIFASPEIPHEKNKFVLGLDGKSLTILRKSGTWEDWQHDLAIVVGPDRHYIVAGLTRHSRGDDYLVDMARAIDDLLAIR